MLTTRCISPRHGRLRSTSRALRPFAYGAACLLSAGLLGPVSSALALEFTVKDRNQYGFGFDGASHRESYTTTFAATGVDSLLSVDGYDIDKSGEVQVLLNGELIGNLLKTANNGEKRTALLIPASKQQGQNTLSFVQAQPGQRWGIRNLLLHDLDAAPITLRVGKTYNQDLGYRYGDRRRYSGLVAEFESATANRQIADLQLDVIGYDIDQINDVAVYVNERLRGHLILSGAGRTARAQSLFIPASWLRSGQNQLRFALSRPGARWGIASIALRKRTTGRPRGSVKVIRPGDNVAAIVNAAPAGTRFYLRRGRYRVTQLSPKSNQVFYCEPNTIISGARTLSGNWRKSGGLWYLDGTPRPLRGNGVMSPGRGVNRFRNDVFIDDALYLRVGNRSKVNAERHVVEGRDVYAGTFFQEGGRLWLPVDPRGRRVEMSSARWAFFASAGAADNVTIENCVIEKYAPEDLEGAIEAKYTSGWLLKNVTARHNHTGGVRIGRDMAIVGGRYVDNGQTGIVGSLVGNGGATFGYSDNILVDSAEIAGNNWAEYDSAWHGGGVKFFRTRGVVMVANDVHHNFGPGLWVDWDVHNTVIEANKIYHNAGVGVEVEAAFYGRVSNNEIKCNATLGRHSQGYSWFWGAQVLVKNSPDITVSGNDIVVNQGQGIGIGDNLDRGSNSRFGRREARNNLVSANTVRFISRPRSGGSDGWTGVNSDAQAMASGLNATQLDRGNRIQANTYIYADASYPHWIVGGGNYNAFGAPSPWEQGSSYQQRSSAELSAEALCP